MSPASNFASTVTDIRLESSAGTQQVWQMALAATRFEPGDSGFLEAVTRSGTRLRLAVTRVIADEEGVFWHVVEKPLAAGTDVLGTVVLLAER